MSPSIASAAQNIGFDACAVAAPTVCVHCGADLGPGAKDAFCCGGCREVYAWIRSEHLERYYDLRGDRGQPVSEAHAESRDRKWLEPIEAKIAAEGGIARVRLDVQGLHCAGCVWLFEEVFRRTPGGAHLLVNSRRSAPWISRSMRPSPLRAWVDQIEHFGYLLGPSRKRAVNKSNDLLLRMGICIAIAMNAMLFAISLYAGLDSGPIFRLFHLLGFGVATASVVVGGFGLLLRSAQRALRSGILYLDPPIAIGVLLAYAGSTYSLVTRSGGGLVLRHAHGLHRAHAFGRWLQERVIEKNRAELLDTAGIDDLLARRIADGHAEPVPVRVLEEGDLLLVAPGDVVPVDARLEEEGASFSLDWITGESAPREHRRGDPVPAGACVAGARAVRLRAASAFEGRGPALVDLLRTPTSAPTTPRAPRPGVGSRRCT